MQHLKSGRMVEEVPADDNKRVDGNHEVEAASPLDTSVCLQGESDFWGQ